MYSLAWLVVVGVIGLIVGGGLGHLVARVRSGGAARVGELEAQLESSQEELSSYKTEVYEQFSETARKFKALDETYHDLQRQLAQSAGVLVGEAAGPLLVAPDGASALELDDVAETTATAEAPAEAETGDLAAEPEANALEETATDAAAADADAVESPDAPEPLEDEPPILVNEAALAEEVELVEGDLVADLDEAAGEDGDQLSLAERIERQQRAEATAAAQKAADA